MNKKKYIAPGFKILPVKINMVLAASGETDTNIDTTDPPVDPDTDGSDADSRKWGGGYPSSWDN
jgi:hypothetical protein